MLEEQDLYLRCHPSRCTLSIAMFPRDLAIVSLLYLVLGDMTAALVGVSFGGDAVVVKLGRSGKKSVEGSLGMFVVCFIICFSYFYDLHLSECTPSTASLLPTCG